MTDGFGGALLADWRVFSAALYASPTLAMIAAMAHPRLEQSDSEHGGRRMTIGEHLDELRGCLVRSVLAFVLTALACIWPAKYLLEIIARPVVLALRRHGQPDSFLATSPVEAILIYIKVVVFAALVISGPYIIYQLWQFVAAGLYPREKEWVRKLVPVSIGLFLAGVTFMYFFTLVLALNFLIGFSAWLPMPTAKPTALEKALLGSGTEEVATTRPAIAEAPTVPSYAEDPNNPSTGALWFNSFENKLKLRGAEETYSVQLMRDEHRAMVTTHFRIGEYLSFVLVLTIAFGLAFQMPLVVVFLVRTGIVSIATLRSYRKIVILVIVIIAGMIAPPDLLSHVMLSGPMWLLFELGLFFAARGQARAAKSSTDDGGPAR
jgi:Sec-independent protein secretion pathway component TatC